MFIKTDIDENYISEFNKLGITNTDDMLTILNGLDVLAEIGFISFNNNQL